MTNWVIFRDGRKIGSVWGESLKLSGGTLYSVMDGKLSASIASGDGLTWMAELAQSRAAAPKAGKGDAN